MRPTLAHVIPNFQNPAGYTLSAAKREKLLALAAEHDFTIFEDDPYISIRFEGEGLPTMLSQDDAGQGRLRVVVLQDGLPRHPRRLPGRPAGGDQADPGDRDQHLHLAEHGRPVDREPVLPLRPDRLGDRDGQGRAARAPRRAWSRRSSASCPRPRSRRPEGGYFMWVELPEAVDVAELEKAAKRARRRVRQGHRLPARGRAQHAAARLLGRDAGADRRGHHPPGRRGALARGHRLGARCASSATTTGAAARSSASCTCPDGDGPRARRRRDPRRLLERPLRPQADAPARAATWPARGWAAWNVEYRRLGRVCGGGWPTTFDDVAAAIDHLAEIRRTPAGPRRAWSRSGTPPAGTWRRGRRPDRGCRGRAGRGPRVPVTGGGLAGRRRRPRAGVGAAAVRRRRRRPARRRAGPASPARYALASPAGSSRSACRCCSPTAGATTSCRRRSASRFAATRAGRRRRGASSSCSPDEDHFGHIDPANPLWAAVLEWLA